MVTNRDRKSFGLRRKNSKICPDDWHRRGVESAFKHFGTHFAENFRMSKSSLMMVQTRSREIPCRPSIDLPEIRRSSKISSWIWKIFSGVVTVLVRPRRGASQVEKSSRLNWATQFWTAGHDGACSSNASLRMAWISFDALSLTHWGRGHSNCLNARSRGLNNLNQLLYCVPLTIYNKFVKYFCELKFSGNTHQRP